jgi:hypothetical protein
MRLNLIPIAAAALLVAPLAHANILFSSIGPDQIYSDGNSNGVTAMAKSFTASSLNGVQAQLLLRAASPNDGGSAVIYLVADDGTGGSPGIAGSPTFTSGSPFPTFGSFTGALVLATINDSALTAAPQLVTVSLPSAFASTNDEYWIALVEGRDSSIEWSYSDGASGADPTWVGQSSFFFNTTGTSDYSGFGANTVSDIAGLEGGFGPYALLVTVPEPMSIALLGAGIAGLGFVRRRGQKS